jgi:hypothetical protein
VTRIGNQISKALVDGRVSKRDVDAVVGQAKANGKISASERAEIANFLKVHGDKFEADAKAALSAFLSGGKPVSGPADTGSNVALSADPRVLQKHDGTLTFNKVPDGVLFRDGVSADDVMQGYIGDCFFVAALSSVAAADPKAIENCIKDNGDGTYTARFFSKGPDGKLKPSYVRVDGDIPSRDPSQRFYAGDRDSSELWVSLIEKAYASWKGGYEAIGEGGFPAEAMTEITGRESSYYDVKENGPEVTFDLLESALKSKVPVAAETFGKKREAMYEGTGVHGNHTYAVVGTSVENGEKFVQLRNPWGFSEPDGDGKDDGTFKLKLQDFMKLFEAVNVNEE